MIIVNARFLTQHLSGVQRYAIEISLRLRALDPSIVFLAPSNIIHHDLAKKLSARVIGKTTGYLWEQIELPLYLKRLGSPLLVNLANMAPVFYKNTIISVHDIAFVKFPIGFSWKFKTVYRLLMPLILNNNHHIITISQFSKNEIMNYYGISSEKITVIYNGIDERFHKKTTIHKEKYILGVSSLDHRKNFKGLIEAYLKIEQPNFKLYIIGEQNSVFKAIEHYESENIKFLGRVLDDELVQYYSDALVFIYPSFYEGFGFPPLEAMACGTAVIVSNTSTLPEVCGDAAYYVDPLDVDSIKNGIMHLIKDGEEKNKFIRKGLLRAQEFSWGKSAKEHLEVFKRVLIQ